MRKTPCKGGMNEKDEKALSVVVFFLGPCFSFILYSVPRLALGNKTVGAGKADRLGMWREMFIERGDEEETRKRYEDGMMHTCTNSRVKRLVNSLGCKGLGNVSVAANKKQ